MSLIAFAPALFVLIWSTGWIVAKYAAMNADPLTFLVVRYVSAAIVVGAFALFARAEWPKTRTAVFHAFVTGVLLHAVYLGGVWWAIGQGLPAGVSALIAAIQPLMTAALVGPVLGERLSWRQVLGVALGFFGVVGVLLPRFAGVSGAALSSLWLILAINALAMIGVTLGTLYQKRFVATGDLRAVTTLQYIGAAIVTLPVAWMTESMRFEPVLETWLALGWSVIVLSIGAVGLMFLMIRRGAVSRVAALIYLVPPTAAVQAYFLFGETLTFWQVGAMVLTATGVYLASRA